AFREKLFPIRSIASRSRPLGRARSLRNQNGSERRKKNQKAHFVQVLSRLSDDIHESGFALHDHIHSPAQRRPKILRIGNWTFAVNAQASCKSRIVDVWVIECRADL